MPAPFHMGADAMNKMDDGERAIRAGTWTWMLEMIDEERDLRLASWARVYLMLAICDQLQHLGGMAGVW